MKSEEQFDVRVVGNHCFLSVTQWSKSTWFTDIFNPK